MITAVSAHGLHSFIPDLRAKVYWLRASLVSCEAALVSFPWFFHWGFVVSGGDSPIAREEGSL